MVVGNPNASVNVILFMDYQSDKTKKIYPTLVQTLSKNPGVSFLVRPLPGETSLSDYALRVALVARDSGKFWTVHNALMARNAPLDEGYIHHVLRQVGLSPSQVKAAAYSDQITERVNTLKHHSWIALTWNSPVVYINYKKISDDQLTFQNIQEDIARASGKKF